MEAAIPLILSGIAVVLAFANAMRGRHASDTTSGQELGRMMEKIDSQPDSKTSRWMGNMEAQNESLRGEIRGVKSDIREMREYLEKTAAQGSDLKNQKDEVAVLRNEMYRMNERFARLETAIAELSALVKNNGKAV